MTVTHSAVIPVKETTERFSSVKIGKILKLQSNSDNSSKYSPILTIQVSACRSEFSRGQCAAKLRTLHNPTELEVRRCEDHPAKPGSNYTT